MAGSLNVPYLSQALASDGDAKGFVTLGSVTGYVVGALCNLYSISGGVVTSMLCKITSIDAANKNVYLRKVDVFSSPILPLTYGNTDCSAFLTMATATLVQQQQHLPMDGTIVTTTQNLI